MIWNDRIVRTHSVDSIEYNRKLYIAISKVIHILKNNYSVQLIFIWLFKQIIYKRN